MLGNFGNLGRNAVRLNGLTNSDWVFLKDTAVTEAMKVQFRAELFNVFKQYKLRHV